MSASDPVTPRPASAVVLLRDGAKGGAEVFMVRRHVRSEFVPDAFVFPGGTVKSGDIEAERAPDLCEPVHMGGRTALGFGFRAAAIRECFEEAGVLIARRGAAPVAIGAADVARFAGYREELNGGTLALAGLCEREGLTLATDALLHWAHWITPEAFPRRYDTHFFLTEMPDEQEAAHDQLETTEGIWIRPDEALARFERGDLPLVFATINQLRELTNLESAVSARERFSGVTPRTIMPRVVQRDGQDVILLPEEDEEGE